MQANITEWRPRAWQWLLAGSLIVALGTAAFALARQPELDPLLPFSLLSGAIFGVVLQRSRFCFYCICKDVFEHRAIAGALGLLVALAVSTVGYHVVFGAFLPDALPNRLPPGAHIGPLSLALVFGAAAFGLGMALAGSCISAQFYRLGEGAFGGLFALFGALIGFILGFLSWNSLYLNFIQGATVWWLPHDLGYGGSLLLQLGVCIALAVALVAIAKPATTPSNEPLAQAIFGRRWPTYIGGLIIGMLGTLAYLRVAPLGVTAELGSLARTAAINWLPFFPSRLEGLDSFRGCAAVVKETVLSHNGLFVIALIIGAWAAALPAGDFKPKWPNAKQSLRLFVGGVLMGWGSMLALGCTVGTLLSGIAAASLSGWVFALVCIAAAWLGWWLRRRFAWLA